MDEILTIKCRERLIEDDKVSDEIMVTATDIIQEERDYSDHIYKVSCFIRESNSRNCQQSVLKVHIFSCIAYKGIQKFEFTLDLPWEICYEKKPSNQKKRKGRIRYKILRTIQSITKFM